METDTGQLNSILSRALSSAFAGVYARDRIPQRLRPYEKAMVINTDPHDKPGAHWVCVYSVPPVVEYFDSYGMKPYFPEILHRASASSSRMESLHLPSLEHYGLWTVLRVFLTTKT